MSNQQVYLRDIVQTFDGIFERSDKQFRRMEPLEWFHDPNSTAMDVLNTRRFETIGGVAIHIPDDRIREFIEFMSPRFKAREMEIRANVPAVQKAYENYRLLLSMCGGDFDARY